MAFQRAEKRKAKLRLALTGVSGAGKTYSALLMAKQLGKKVAVIDSERGSASLYADRFEFDSQDLTLHSVDMYRRAIKEAAAAGYDVLVVDSLSHEWAGRGGVLEAVDAKKEKSSFNAWNGPSQAHASLVDDLLMFPGHVIVTMRSKTEYVLEEYVKDGRKVQAPKKVGLAPVQREGVEYEFTVLLSLDKSGSVTVEKSRCSAVEEKGSTLRREDLGEVAETLKAWLESGVEAPAPAPARAPATQAITDMMAKQSAYPAPGLAPASFAGQSSTERAAEAAMDAYRAAKAQEQAAQPKPTPPPVGDEVAAAKAEIAAAPTMAALAAIGNKLIKLPAWKTGGLRDAFTLRQQQLVSGEKAEAARGAA